MTKITLTIFVKSEKRATSNPDFDSYGHNCAAHFKTGAHDRTGAEIGFMSNDQLMLLDAATRACEKMGWDLEIIDVSKDSLFKRLRMKAPVPRLECNGKIVTGIPTSDEIIQFFQLDNPVSLMDKVESKIGNRMVEVS